MSNEEPRETRLFQCMLIIRDRMYRLSYKTVHFICLCRFLLLEKNLKVEYDAGFNSKARPTDIVV